MMRPILTLLSAKLFGDINESSIFTAATFEFTHTASLVHDDVVDESEERRGLPSVNSIYNNKVAVLVGDYILASGLLNAYNAGNSEIVKSYLPQRRNWQMENSCSSKTLNMRRFQRTYTSKS